MKTKTPAFKTFPEFSELTLDDRDYYNGLIANFPPLMDLSFGNLMTWWSAIDNPRISQLGKNLIISYWLPGNEEASGLSIVGTDHIDEAVCQVLDYFHQTNEHSRLVHVPEFVISTMKYPELYNFTGERDFDECIISVANFSKIENILPGKKWKIRRFLDKVGDSSIQVKNIDLSQSENRRSLSEAINAWEKMGQMNKLYKHEKDSIAYVINHTEELGMDCLGLYVRNELVSFLHYEFPSNEEYVLTGYARFNYEVPFIFELSVHEYAKWFASQGVKYVNIDADIGNSFMRSIKVNLGPTNFFRKYTITPCN